jgi:hypothetical protein
MLMDSKQQSLLEAHGWVIECEDPLEIRHTNTGSFATLGAVEYIIAQIEAAQRPTRAELLLELFLLAIENQQLKKSPATYKITQLATAITRELSQNELFAAADALILTGEIKDNEAVTAILKEWFPRDLADAYELALQES